MSQQELLKLVIQRLQTAGIEYMLTGSLASSMQGEPRGTHDIDLLIAIRASAAEAARVPEPSQYLERSLSRLLLTL